MFLFFSISYSYFIISAKLSCSFSIKALTQSSYLMVAFCLEAHQSNFLVSFVSFQKYNYRNSAIKKLNALWKCNVDKVVTSILMMVSRLSFGNGVM